LREKKTSEVAILATQIWLIPLADDQESTYFTKLKRKKKKEKEKPFFLQLKYCNTKCSC
jgi:hypothetical protein